MAAIPVRKPLIPITDRETAFNAITQLHKEFLEIHNLLLGPSVDDAEKGQLEGLLKTILTDLAAAHRELQKYPAEVFVPTLKSAPRPMAKGKTSVAVQSAQIQLDQFEGEHLSFATAFKKMLYNEKERFTSEQKAAAERQYQDLKEEQSRLLKILKLQESPMRYLALLAQSKVPKNNYLQIGSTKFYMNDISGTTGIPIFKDYFFKPDDNVSEIDNKFKLDQVKAIFQKVFTVPQGQPLPICDKLDTSYLEEGLKFYLDVLRSELQKKQSERGANAIPVRTLLVKVEDSKSLIDSLLEKQLDICRKGVKEPEPEPEVGHIGSSEMKKILRKVFLILAAKQKQVPGYEKQMKVADELLALLSPASIPTVENTNLPKIEKNFQDVIESTKNFKMLYMLGKGSADEIIENIQKSFALQLLKKLETLITASTYLTEEEKVQIIEGIDFQHSATSKEHIELLQQRLLTISKIKEDKLIKLRTEAELVSKKLQKEMEDHAKLDKLYTELNKAYTQLQTEHERLKELQGSNQTLEAQIVELKDANKNIRTELLAKNEDIVALTGQLTTAQEQITDLETNLAKCNADLATCSTDKNILNATIQKLQGTIAEKNAALETQKEESAATLQATITTKNAELEKQRQDKQAEIDGLTQRISELETLRASLETQLVESSRLTQEIQYKYSALLQEKNTLLQLEKSLKEQITTLTTEATKKDNDNKALAAQLALATKSLSDIQAAKRALDLENENVLKEIQKEVPGVTRIIEGIRQLSTIKKGLEERIEKDQNYINELAIFAVKIRNANRLTNLEGANSASEPEGGPIHIILKRVRELLNKPSVPVAAPSVPVAAPGVPAAAPVVPAEVPGVPAAPVVPAKVPSVPAPVVPASVIPAEVPGVPVQSGGKCSLPLTQVSMAKTGIDTYRLPTGYEYKMQKFPFCLSVLGATDYSREDFETKATINFQKAFGPPGSEKFEAARKKYLDLRIPINPTTGRVAMRGGKHTRKIKKQTNKPTTR